MARYIDADIVVTRLDEIQPFAGNKAANAAINLCKDIVRNAPTISPDEVRGAGKWIEGGYFDDMLGDVADFETVIPANKEETE